MHIGSLSYRDVYTQTGKDFVNKIYDLSSLDILADSACCRSCSVFERATLRDSPFSCCTMSEEKATEFLLSPLDMLMPRMHVPKLLYFVSAAEPPGIVSKLLGALELTIKSLPIIAGSVAASKQDGVQKGSLSVQSPFFAAHEILSVNDLRDEYDYEQLQAAQFPTNVLAVEAIAPKQFGKAADSAPVMVAQANFFRGGLLLFLGFHHCVVDEVGMFNVMKIWSLYCRGEVALDFVTPQWFDRSPLLQGAGTGKVEDHPEYRLAPEGATARATEDPSVYFPDSPDVQSRIYFLSDKALERLKLAATVPSTNDGVESATWVSTNDALIALFWCCVTSARMVESKRATSEIFPLFAMAVNGRQQLQPPIPSDYCGNMVLIAKTLAKADDLLAQEPGRLAKAASLVRKAVNVVDGAYARDVIQMVQNIDDLNRLAPRRRPAMEHSLGCTTWARQPYYSLDWGNTIGGACQRVRGRRYTTDGSFIIFPRMASAESLNGPSDGRQGGIEVQLVLRSEHHQRLLEDPVFTEFAEWRCS